MNKKKLLFYTKMNFGNVANSGIKNKVFAQLKAFRNLDFDTDIFYFENKEIIIEGDNANRRKTFDSKLKFIQYLYFGFLNHVDIEKYDMVYIRHFLTNPLFLFALKTIKKRNPNIKILMELPTYPYKFQNHKLSLSLRIQQKIDDLCVPFFKKYINQIVTISLDKEIFGIRTIITDNGIDVDKYGVIVPNKSTDKTIHLLGLANVQSWHGFDRILEGLANYKKTKSKINVVFHVVGNGDVLDELKSQAQRNDLSDCVIFHGFLTGIDLEEMFSKCQIGVAVLGLHRVNLHHASALKAREFTSRGLPFMASHDDYGFPDSYPYILKVPSTDDPINIESVIKFVNTLDEHPNYHIEMNNYAKNNFKWETMLKPIKDYLTEFE
jgi:glycosyltransferase involved in cell wall biosynthesis